MGKRKTIERPQHAIAGVNWCASIGGQSVQGQALNILSALKGRLNLNLDKSGDETAGCGDDDELIAISLAFKRCHFSTVNRQIVRDSHSLQP